eukprot:CAMPEP_0196655634 /NCGR_PEP_ID=MMETSP1086-20130531/5385_1 /TAXON_ID=77921 /ORGANISM="Cyanoptyche  gloeocystis , Strain SAG4.97" /LENGTH=647 /DNA_ID=CAMNT_0041988049 /DNA_START=70 /DNA_END=2013 /DNA_ORIENTATION=-
MCFNECQRELVDDISNVGRGAVKHVLNGEAQEEIRSDVTNKVRPTARLLVPHIIGKAPCVSFAPNHPQMLPVSFFQRSKGCDFPLLQTMPKSGCSEIVQRVTVGLANTYAKIYKSVAGNLGPKVQNFSAASDGVASVAGQHGVHVIAQKPHPLEDQNVSKNDSRDDDNTDRDADAELDDEDGFHKEKPGEIFHNRYVVEELLGRGTFGKVIKCYNRVRREYVVIKVIRNTPAFFEAAQREIQMLKVMNKADPHDKYNIVRMKDHFVFHSHQCIVFELLAESLYDLLRSGNFRGVSLNAISKFSRQILASLEFMSRPDVNIMHCDLKPENILLRSSNTRAIKVIDFGSSCQETRQYYTYIQSRYYRAPEVILRFPCYTKAVDMWSLGCLLCEMHTGHPIFDGRDILEQVQSMYSLLGIPPEHMLRRGTQTSSYFAKAENDCNAAISALEGRWELLPWISKGGMKRRNLNDILGVYSNGPEGRWKNHTGHTSVDYENFKDLVAKMLVYDPSQRITPAEALKHPFFANEWKALRRPTVEHPLGFECLSAPPNESSALQISREDVSNSEAVPKWKQGSANDKQKSLGARENVCSDDWLDGWEDATLGFSDALVSGGYVPLISKPSAIVSKKQGPNLSIFRDGNNTFVPCVS